MVKGMKKKFLFFYSILILPIMSLLFTLLSNHYGKTIGYFLPYTVYLTILLAGVICFYARKEKFVYFPIKHSLLYYGSAFIPVVAIFFVAFLPLVNKLTPQLLLFTFAYALLNGILEELFWRFTFNKMFGNNIWFSYVVPTVIFSCWHFALLFAKGVTYGGAAALVGGACMMGAIWGIVMYKTKNIKVVICAHVLANFFAFSQLIYNNWC